VSSEHQGEEIQELREREGERESERESKRFGKRQKQRTASSLTFIFQGRDR
jgi:hypothetical protein